MRLGFGQNLGWEMGILNSHPRPPVQPTPAPLQDPQTKWVEFMVLYGHFIRFPRRHHRSFTQTQYLKQLPFVNRRLKSFLLISTSAFRSC